MFDDVVRHRIYQTVDLILTRSVSEGLLLKTRQQLSLTHVSGCESPLNQRPVCLGDFQTVARQIVEQEEPTLTKDALDRIVKKPYATEIHPVA